MSILESKLPSASVAVADAAMALRRNDYSLSAAQLEIQALFHTFFSREVPSARVRESEAVGFDPSLWRQVCELGGAAIGLPEDLGGNGLGLVDLVLVAQELGAFLAPVPLIESLTAARLIANVDSEANGSALAELAAGKRIATLALRQGQGGESQLVPAGAVADLILGYDGRELVMVEPGERLRHVRNQGSQPLAWVDLTGSGGRRTVLATGQAARVAWLAAVEEWKLLTAAALIGLGDAAVRMATAYAIDRHAFGAPIGSFQSVANALVDATMALEGGRNLNLKAAWFLDNERAAKAALVPMAFAQATRAATKAVTVAVHVHGGTGFMVETDVTLYFLRAKAWSVLAGDPVAELDAIADHVMGSQKGPF
jgi:alkylation response protein AidB-like acyl-CoA dehydrogenase